MNSYSDEKQDLEIIENEKSQDQETEDKTDRKHMQSVTQMKNSKKTNF